MVDAAYDMSMIRKAAGEQAFRDWYKKTSDAFVGYKAGNKDAIGTREADMGAEAAYFFVNEQIEKEWDTAPGQEPKIKYVGTSDKVSAQLKKDDEKRVKYVESLEKINETYVSPKWYPVVNARQGTVDDVQRTALAKSKVEVLDPKAQKTIKDIEDKAQKTLDNPKATDEEREVATKLLEKADKIRQSTAGAWKETRAKYYAVLEPEMIDRYARGYVRGKQFDVKDPMVTKAVQRLAYYTDQLDNTKMKLYLTNLENDTKIVPRFVYRNDMFKQARPGSIVAPLPSTDNPMPPVVSAGASSKPE